MYSNQNPIEIEVNFVKKLYFPCIGFPFNPKCIPKAIIAKIK
jgi:hypothetical protein